MDDSAGLCCESFFEHAPCGLVVMAVDGRLLRCNQTFSHWLGYDSAALHARSFDQLLTAAGRVFQRTHWGPLLNQQGSVSEVKLELRHRQGHVLALLLNGVRRETAEGVRYHLALVGTTARDRNERAVFVAMQRAEELLAQKISAQAALQRAQRMIVDLLDFASVRLGQGIRVRREQVDLRQALDQCVSELRVAFAAATIRHLSRGHGTCELDQDRLQQMIGNLVANGVAYGDLRYPITLTSDLSEQGTTLSVHNHGPVIAQGLIPSLFEPMTRGSEQQDPLRSVGLGLFIVKQIVQAHGGSIGVHSSATGGTTFTIRLPARQVSPAADGQETPLAST